MSKPLVVGLGEILWDLLPSGKQLGGAPANFAYHAQAQGAAGYVVSCVGADELGAEIRRQVAGLGLNREQLETDSEHPTGTVSVELDAGGKPTYVIHENVAWDFVRTNPAMLQVAAQADAVCFGSLAQRSPVTCATIRDFLAATRPDSLRIFDINLRQHYYNVDTVTAGLTAANVLKLNDEELPVVAQLLSLSGTEAELLAALCRQFALRLIALTKGAQGSVLFTPDVCSTQPSAPAQIVDTVGAGDSFTAVLAMGLLAGADLDVINRKANRVAAYVCGQHGATPPLPPELVG